MQGLFSKKFNFSESFFEKFWASFLAAARGGKVLRN